VGHIYPTGHERLNLSRDVHKKALLSIKDTSTKAKQFKNLYSYILPQDKTIGHPVHDNKNTGTPYFMALHIAQTLGNLKFDKLHFLVRFSDWENATW